MPLSQLPNDLQDAAAAGTLLPLPLQAVLRGTVPFRPPALRTGQREVDSRVGAASLRRNDVTHFTAPVEAPAATPLRSATFDQRPAVPQVQTFARSRREIRRVTSYSLRGLTDPQDPFPFAELPCAGIHGSPLRSPVHGILCLHADCIGSPSSQTKWIEKTMVKIGLFGAAGHMGRMRVKAIDESGNCTLVGGCEKPGSSAT